MMVACHFAPRPKMLSARQTAVKAKGLSALQVLEFEQTGLLQLLKDLVDARVGALARAAQSLGDLGRKGLKHVGGPPGRRDGLEQPSLLASANR
jgi:hypothetical protein